MWIKGCLPTVRVRAGSTSVYEDAGKCRSIRCDDVIVKYFSWDSFVSAAYTKYSIGLLRKHPFQLTPQLTLVIACTFVVGIANFVPVTETSAVRADDISYLSSSSRPAHGKFLLHDCYTSHSYLCLLAVEKLWEACNLNGEHEIYVQCQRRLPHIRWLYLQYLNDCRVKGGILRALQLLVSFMNEILFYWLSRFGIALNELHPAGIRCADCCWIFPKNYDRCMCLFRVPLIIITRIRVF